MERMTSVRRIALHHPVQSGALPMQTKKQMSIKRSSILAAVMIRSFMAIAVTVSFASAVCGADIDDPELWIDPDGIKGQLVICGGGALPESVRKEFVEQAGGSGARILVIPTASQKADEAATDSWML